jgi:hypothetical protein
MRSAALCRNGSPRWPQMRNEELARPQVTGREARVLVA